MKIYVIQLPKCDYDEFKGFVIVANSENEVRFLSVKESELCNMSDDFNKNASVVEIGNYTGEQKEPFIVLSDFNAG